ncbi:exodeoxyribonuclease III [Smaragdicoccus niigatensis]
MNSPGLSFPTPAIVSTINVNGVRAAARKGLLDWLASTEADFVCVQEVRATDADAQKALEPAISAGWHFVHTECTDKGRAGVGILSRRPADAVRVGFEGDVDLSGRYLEADFGGLTVASVYVPTGDAGTPRQDEKEQFLAALRTHMLRNESQYVVCGDWNVAHTELDIKAWKTNLKNSGFLPSERAWLDSVVGPNAPFVDVVRHLHPGTPGPYSWWSYRGRAFDNDAGWRIDCHFATPDRAHRAKDARVERADAYDQRWSDHAPVTVQYR